jgi:hypothetical protein
MDTIKPRYLRCKPSPSLRAFSTAILLLRIYSRRNPKRTEFAIHRLPQIPCSKPGIAIEPEPRGLEGKCSDIFLSIVSISTSGCLLSLESAVTQSECGQDE